MIQAINSTNNVNFNGRFLSTAANHIQKNATHYCLNAGYFTTAAFLADNPARVLLGKAVIDTLESLIPIFSKKRLSIGLANFDNPLTNTAFWVGKGTDKLLNKFFSKNIH